MKLVPFTFIIIIGSVLTAFAQDPKHEISRATEVFLKAVEANDFGNIQDILAEDEVNIFGQIWMKPSDAMSLLSTILKDKSFSFEETTIFDFDACVSDTLLRKYTFIVHRVFDNASYISLSFSGSLANADPLIGLVFKQVDTEWRIVSVFMLPPPGLLMSNDAGTPDTFRLHKITQRAEMSLPPSFEKLTSPDGQASFRLMRNGIQTAVFSIFVDSVDFSQAPPDISDPMYVFARNAYDYFVTSRFPYDKHRIQLVPNGYRLECSVTDPSKNVNKSIMHALRVPSTNTTISIFFFAFEAEYNSIWQEVDLSLRSVKFK